MVPNFTQAGAAFATDGTKPRYFGRSSFTRWIVPIDDTNTKIIAWANFGEKGDPPKRNTPEDIEKIEQGETLDRPYTARQRRPGDYEASVGQGPITIHKREHLTGIDKGVAMMRTRLRRAIRDVGKGKLPLQPNRHADGPVPTYGGDTVLHVPTRVGADDRKRLRDIAQAVVAAHFEADHLQGAERIAFVERRLKEIEAAA